MDENTMDFWISLAVQIPLVAAFMWYTLRMSENNSKNVDSIQGKFVETNQNILNSCEKSQERIFGYLESRDTEYNESLGELKTAVTELRTAVREMGDKG